MSTSSEFNVIQYTQAEEDGLDEQFQTFLSSLPKQKGWAGSELYQYQGFWHNAWILQAIVTCQNHFQANHDDLFLVTNPKSGTTWLKALAFALVNRNQFSPSSHQHPLLTQNPHGLVPFLELNLYIDDENPDLTSMPSPRLLATHLPYASLPNTIKQSGSKLVYLCRDPRDTFISMWHFTQKINPEGWGDLSLDEEFERFCKGVCVNGPFWDHILAYWKKSSESPETVLFLKFEEMKAQPSVQLRRLAKFLGYPFSDEEEKAGVVEEIVKLCSFDTMTNLDVNKSNDMPAGVEAHTYFRKGKVGDWVNHLTPEMIKKCEQVMEHEFHGSGLTF